MDDGIETVEQMDEEMEAVFNRRTEILCIPSSERTKSQAAQLKTAQNRLSRMRAKRRGGEEHETTEPARATRKWKVTTLDWKEWKNKTLEEIMEQHEERTDATAKAKVEYAGEVKIAAEYEHKAEMKYEGEGGMSLYVKKTKLLEDAEVKTEVEREHGEEEKRVTENMEYSLDDEDDYFKDEDEQALGQGVEAEVEEEMTMEELDESKFTEKVEKRDEGGEAEKAEKAEEGK